MLLNRITDELQKKFQRPTKHSKEKITEVNKDSFLGIHDMLAECKQLLCGEQWNQEFLTVCANRG